MGHKIVDGKLLFYGADSFYSNFSPHGCVYQGHKLLTVEHGYQAWKFWARAYEDNVFMSIINASSPEEAKRIAHAYQPLMDPEWKNKKFLIMSQIVRAKFEQHKEKWLQIAETGYIEMVEDSPTDSYWGRGPDWDGHNFLGKIWMSFRVEAQIALGVYGPSVR